MTRRLSEIDTYRGLRTTILGLGTFGGGVAAARFLARRGAVVTVTDRRPAAELEESIASLADVDIRSFYLGGHPDAAFVGCELLVISPAVRPASAEVEHCRSAGVILTSEIELFLNHCPARIIAITGSNGKSTTAVLTHRLLQPLSASADTKSWLGGNIGTSLLPVVDDISSDDIVVLELSSFQLEYLRQANFSPSVAVVTSFAANHLDWHGDVVAYHKAKQVVLNRQKPDDVAVLPDDSPVNQPGLDDGVEPVWRVRGQCLRFGIRDSGEDGVFLEDGLRILRRGRHEDAVRCILPPHLRGVHNVHNAAAAMCAAWVSGVDPDTFAESLSGFAPLPHRLQLVAEGKGRLFYNDSGATTAESAIAALEAFDRPLVIIAGGSDKGTDLTRLSRAISRRASAAVLIGQTAGILAAHVVRFSVGTSGPQIVRPDDFQNAFSQAVALTPQGGIVLLSPGCASYGWFRDYRERGDRFTQMARDWIRS